MMNYKNLLKQFIEFGLIGGFNAVLSYLITNLDYYILGFHEQICNLIAFIITVYISFGFRFKKNFGLS